MRARSITRAKRPVEVEGSADETQVRERLGEIAEGLTAPPCFFGVQPKMVGVTEHLLKDQTGLVQRATIDSTGPRERLDQPSLRGSPTGMKSVTWPTPSAVRNRVIKTLVSGR